MPKRKVEAPKRELTKRQLTHHQRQNRIQRFTLWGGLAVIIAVLALVGTGIYMNKIKPITQTVFKVGDTSYSMGYYIDAIDYYGQENYQFFQNYGIDYTQYLGYTINSYANTIQQNQIIKEEAAKLDPPIMVSNDEIDKYIKDNNLTKNKAVTDAIYAALLEDKLTAKFDKALPESAEHRAVLAMFLESQSQVDSVKARIAAGETFNAIAESLSLDSTTKTKSGDLGWVPKNVIPTILNNADDKTLDDLVFDPNTKVNVLIQAEDKTKGKSMGYWLIQVVEVKPGAAAAATTTPAATPTNDSQAKVNVMLLPNQALALDIKNQLANGADFATLAKANSQYTNVATDGGILDFIKKGTLGGAADTYLFPDDSALMPKAGQISDPIADTAQTTNGGFWLANVTGIENKTLDGTNRSTLANIDKQAWRNQTWTDNSSKVADMLDQTKIDYASAQALARYNKK